MMMISLSPPLCGYKEKFLDCAISSVPAKLAILVSLNTTSIQNPQELDRAWDMVRIKPEICRVSYSALSISPNKASRFHLNARR